MSKLDEARKRWGTAETIQGGGQASSELDLARWAGQPLKSDDEPLTGIAANHFLCFEATAQAEKCLIVVRKTKAACLPWIKLDYPAKPAKIWKIKNSVQTGLVTCSVFHDDYSYQEQVEHAWAADHYVLEPVEQPTFGAKSEHFRRQDGGEVGARLGTARNPGARGSYQQKAVFRARKRGELLARQFSGPYYEAGQVIDPESLLPLTGDYDLMGAFPVDNPGGKALVLIHDSTAPAAALESVPGRGQLLKMRENPYVMKIARALNERFGGRPRIMHGAHDLKYDPTKNNKDGCAVFSPRQTFWLDSAMAVQSFYEAIGRLKQLARPERLEKPAGSR